MHSPRLTSAPTGTNAGILHDYMTLTQHGAIQAEYIWIGGSGLDLRSKTKTLKGPINNISELPEWNYDGSSTGQASGNDSEVWLKPIKMVPDPFRKLPNTLVLCETLNAATMKPLDTNKRSKANEVFEHKNVKAEEPWFGIEQEYTLFEADDITPLGWPRHGFPAPQGPYYCGVGKGKANGRHVVEAHYRACLYAGINISGINAEVMPGQWEFQVGPCLGIDSGDQVWLARYILERVGEDFGVCVSFDPKPIRGDWNGAGSHTNYSTKSMRTPPKSKDEKKSENEEKLGMDAILEGIGKLAANHKEHMLVYGAGNDLRLLGSHETAKFDEFSYGVANRGASVRIPRQTNKDGYGYLEDRRPAANCDPYDVTGIIAKTTLLS
jgi:glutamine synthetase